eukprot:8191900-Pyramimonas_sp.AAC.1
MHLDAARCGARSSLRRRRRCTADVADASAMRRDPPTPPSRSSIANHLRLVCPRTSIFTESLRSFRRPFSHQCGCVVVCSCPGGGQYDLRGDFWRC